MTCSPGEMTSATPWSGSIHSAMALSWVSVMYAEELNSAKSSVTLRSTDRHGILGQKSADFQVSL